MDSSSVHGTVTGTVTEVTGTRPIWFNLIFSLPSKEGNNNCKGAVTHLVTFWDLYFPRLRSQTLELQCRHPPEAGELATGKSAQNLLDSLLLFH